MKVTPRPLASCSGWRSQWIGFVVSPVLVLLMTILRTFIESPAFIWLPFCLVVVAVAISWGVGPAIFSMSLAILSVSYIVAPQYHILSLDISRDISVLAPAIMVQILIALLAGRYTAQRKKLEKTKLDLEGANQVKDYFFTRAAHELRTPLTAILTESQLALRRLSKNSAVYTTATYMAHFERIVDRSRTLQALIEDLVELYNLRSNDVPLRKEPCHIQEICEDVIEDCQEHTDRQIILHVCQENITIQADPLRFRQVCSNLLENAVKYSPDNTDILVDIQCNKQNVVLSVHNESHVFADENQNRIFEPFYRTPSAESSGKEGWGLGLTICKDYIKKHGGDIWVENNGGVTFFVSLPYGTQEIARYD